MSAPQDYPWVMDFVLRSTAMTVAVICVFAGVANAQPGRTPSAPAPVPQPHPSSQNGPTLVPPPPPVSAEDLELIERGEISSESHILGAAAGLFFGFGLGHIVQNRWHRTGFLYTVGEIAAIVLIAYGLDDCITLEPQDSNCLMTGIGFYSFLGLRLIEVGDTLFYPSAHNGKVRRAKARAGHYYTSSRPRLHLSPARGGGVTGGVSFRF